MAIKDLSRNKAQDLVTANKVAETKSKEMQPGSTKDSTMDTQKRFLQGRETQCYCYGGIRRLPTKCEFNKRSILSLLQEPRAPGRCRSKKEQKKAKAENAHCLTGDQDLSVQADNETEEGLSCEYWYTTTYFHSGLGIPLKNEMDSGTAVLN